MRKGALVVTVSCFAFLGAIAVLTAMNAVARRIEGTPAAVWEVPPTAGSQDAGLQTMKTMGCFVCHRIDNFGGTIGPRLNGVRTRKAPEQLFAWIRNPGSIKPGTIMPQFDLTDQQIRDVISYLETVP